MTDTLTAGPEAVAIAQDVVERIGVFAGVSNADYHGGALRANKHETFDCLKFTLEGAGERSDGNARTPALRLACFA